MTYEYNSSSYELKLMNIGIKLGEPFKRAKEHHLLICNHCGHQWIATPVSKIQAFKKYGHNGCPECDLRRRTTNKIIIRQRNVQKLKERGIVVLSNWGGTTGAGKESKPVNVTVENVICGHVFTSTSKNLLTRNVSCPICNKEKKIEKLNASSQQRSEEWKKTASEWKQYKSAVMKLTRINYKSHKQQINPHNFPQGKAGVEGAYHLDHIVPIRYCYNQQIPVELCAHPDNLQLLNWRDNVGSRDKLKVTIPHIFNEYINVL